MPELPEVETTLRGISPHILGRQVESVVVRQPRLRYLVPEYLADNIQGESIRDVARRGKYLLVAVGGGHILIHLGMSGSLRMVPAAAPAGKHDHLDIVLSSGQSLRYTDPRRFGVVDWLEGDPWAHPLLRNLGPEPLGRDFSGGYLHRRAGSRKVPVKGFIMDSQVVVGVGNIYANEALFLSGIHPLRDAGRISLARYDLLADTVRTVLARAIAQGGTTLRDFVGGDGRPGYFKQSLQVYGRGALPCCRCGSPLREVRLAQRTTVYCPRCQR